MFESLAAGKALSQPDWIAPDRTSHGPHIAHRIRSPDTTTMFSLATSSSYLASRRNRECATPVRATNHGVSQAQPENPSAFILASYGSATCVPGVNDAFAVAQSSGFKTTIQPSP